MRLLNVHSLDFQWFEYGNTPPYGILSHTWCDNEVDYQTVAAKPGDKKGRGWEKILGTCRQAILNDLDWVWIDTCNIDKTSSAELSEAINSMFVWYQKSTICYVLLEDVEVEDGEEGNDYESILRSSRWFTRGWTLQEMIAPPNVHFYSVSWKWIGTKSTLRPALSQITGVHEEVLENGAMLSTLSVAQKMSWASNRKTTRVEDIAYCLLGIFGVTMPLLYGEGSRAFIRLQEELLNRFNDQTMFAWTFSVPGASETDERDDRASESLFNGGILASHPAAFRHSGKIVQVSRLNSATEPITITTRGILLEAYLMDTDIPTVKIWLLPCSATDDRGVLVAIPLNTPSTHSKRYSRVDLHHVGIQYLDEGYASDLSYQRIYLKKGVEYQAHPASRICYLRSYPSHLIKPMEGRIVDLDKTVGEDPTANYTGSLHEMRRWNEIDWNVDLGTRHLHSAIGLLFKFTPCTDGSKFLHVTISFPGPVVISVTRYSTHSLNLEPEELLDVSLKCRSAMRELIAVEETSKTLAVKVDLEVEHGGLVYAIDVHFEPTEGQSDRFVLWKEGDEKEKFMADHSVRLQVTAEQEEQFQKLRERHDSSIAEMRAPNLVFEHPSRLHR